MQVRLEGALLRISSEPGLVVSAGPTQQKHGPLGGKWGFCEIQGVLGESPVSTAVVFCRGGLGKLPGEEVAQVQEGELVGHGLRRGVEATGDLADLASTNASTGQGLNGMGAKVRDECSELLDRLYRGGSGCGIRTS